jgi:glycosyltransferase involved in cell wall biosynthesis
MRIAYITSGAAGMFCGSCLKDNALVTALIEQGHDAILVPTFTPIRTDDPDVSEHRLFMGGVNVYLQQKSWLFRHTPRFVDWLLNRPGLVNWLARRSVEADYGQLAELTESMLKGEHGLQRKELVKLTDWLAAEVKPEVVVLTNALLSGLVPAVKRALDVPVVVTLQGDDLFLDALPAAARKRCIDLIQGNDRDTAGYIATSKFYADHMADYLGISRGKIEVVYPGISLKGHGGPAEPDPTRPPTVGYFARISPEKGFHNLVEAFIKLRQRPDAPPAKLKAAGWLGPQHQAYLDTNRRRLEQAGLLSDFEHVDCPDHASKVRFLRSLDVLSVPTQFLEPKGLYVLEAGANGVPVVQPRHGSFPELIAATGGGVLVEPNDPNALAAALDELLRSPGRRVELGRKGAAGVREQFTHSVMAERTVGVLNRYVRPAVPA